MEAALSLHLGRVATTLETREQLAIGEFAQALLVNAVKDSWNLGTSRVRPLLV